MGLIAFSLVGSLACKLLHVNAGVIPPVASVLTLASGCIAVFSSVERRTLGNTVLQVLAIGLAAEIIGLYTGFPFGRYAYSDHWVPTIQLANAQRFPILLPFAWLLITGASYCTVARLMTTGYGAVIGGALLATLVDFVMEPVMTNSLGYWHWLNPGPLPGGAPILNVVGWLLVSLAACFVLDSGIRSRPRNDEPIWVLAGHVVLTLGLGAISALGPASNG